MTAISHYERALRLQRAAARAMGDYLIARVESGDRVGDCRYENGHVKGTDMCLIGVISASRASRARKAAALRSIRAAGDLPMVAGQ